MAVWAIGDLHLSFGVSGKSMDIFGEKWVRHAEKIRENWLKSIKADDLVLIPGDISWAMRLEDVVADLQWIDQLPGTKVMIRGNHDYWWHSLSQISKILPPSIHLIQNNAFHWKEIGVAGARLWDTPEYRFDKYIDYVERKRPVEEKQAPSADDDDKIFQREIQRLEMSLKEFKPTDKIRIVMTHYPPISADLQQSQVSRLLDRYQVNICVFGHLHNVKQEIPLFGEREGIRYILTACDYLNFKPVNLEIAL